MIGTSLVIRTQGWETIFYPLPPSGCNPQHRIYNSKGQVKEGMNGSPEVACTNKGHIRPASPKNVIGHRQSWAVLKYIVVITVSKQLYCRDTLYGIHSATCMQSLYAMKYLEAYIMECLSKYFFHTACSKYKQKLCGLINEPQAQTLQRRHMLHPDTTK